MPDTRVSLPEKTYNQIKALAGKMGMREGELLKEIIDKSKGEGQSLEEIVEDLEIEFGSTKTTRKAPGARTRTIYLRDQRQRVMSDPLDRIANKMEKILGIKLMRKLVSDLDLNPSEEALLHSRNPNYPRQPITPQKTDIMAFVKEVKALEMLDKQTTDPEVKAMLKELKDAQVKLFKDVEKPPSARQDLRRRLDELKEYAMTMRIFGTPEEAKKADRAVQNELKEMRKELHKTQLDGIKAQMERQDKEFQRQISEIKNAPSQFDQIARISALSSKDPAVKAYLHKKLGISEKKSLTPESIAKTIKEIQVPLGELIDGAVKAVRGVVKAPAQPPPPPPRPTEIPQTPPTPPREAHLPIETEVTPTPPPEVPIEVPIETTPEISTPPTPIEPPVKRSRGRPKGSKNKPKPKIVKEVIKSE